MSRNIRFAIIGCGRIAEKHAQEIAKRGVLAGACDILKDRADSLANKYNAQPFYDIGDLISELQQIDVAVICTPNGLHAEHTIQCLNAGMNVLCEKPMAIKEKDCRAMIHAADSAGKILAIVKQNRFNPPVVAVKKILDSGRLGRIFSVQLNCFWNRGAEYYQNSSWKGSSELDGGTLFTQFSHFVDLLYWFLGEVNDIRVITRNFNHTNLIAFEDCGVAILEFKNGAIGTLNFTINCYEKNMEGSITLFAENGTVKIGGEYLNKLEYQNLKGDAIGELPLGEVNDYGTYKGSMSNHGFVYDNLLAGLQGDQPISASPYDGMTTVQIIEKIYGNNIGKTDHSIH